MRKQYLRSLVTLLLAVLFLLQPVLAAEIDTLNLVEFSHHDLGWHKDSFINESNFTNGEINDALNRMREDPTFTWTHEYGRYLYEYLKAYPERYEELAQRVAEGRFDIGAGYTQPQTSFVTSEMLVRQFIYGKKWVEELFPGFESEVYYNTDIPGLGVQMPQILAKSGVDFLYASRSWNFDGYTPSEFKQWEAMDGSRVNTFFMNHYGNGQGTYMSEGGISGNAYIVNRINEYMADMEANPNLGSEYALLYGQDCSMPADFAERIEEWNAYAAENGLPEMKYSTMQAALKGVFAGSGAFSEEDTLTGEWPNKWFYENAASDYETFVNQREAERYLRAAETLAVLRAILTKSFEEYPAAELEDGWRLVDYACHGYAPAAVIEEFRETYQKAYDIGKSLYEENLEWLISQIGTDSEKGDVSFVVYNSLSWERDDVVVMEKPEGIGSTFKLTDSDGKEIAYQLTDDGQIVFVAEAVPSMGYQTYYIQDGEAPAASEKEYYEVDTTWTEAFSSRYYTVTPVAEGGALESVVDLENDEKSLFAAEKFKIGELYDFRYDGMGAGEQRHIWQPYNGESQLAAFDAWECVESGPVRTVFETSAEETSRGPATLRLTVYEDLKRIDFDLKMDLDSEGARQLRLMFPVNTGSLFADEAADDGYYYIDNSDVQVKYEVPFGTVTVGDEVLKKFSKYNDQSAYNDVGNDSNQGNLINEGTRPREVQNWIEAVDGNKDTSMTFSTYNLGWDYQDATRLDGEDPVKTAVLQPVLMSSSEACHGGYGKWLQPGEHLYHFSMTSGDAESTEGHRMGVAANNPLDARVREDFGGALPEVYSAFSVDSDHIMITAVKKAEDDMQNIVLRYYETEGQDAEDVTITLPDGAQVEAVKEVNLIERDTGAAGRYTASGSTVTGPVDPWSIETAMITVADMPDLPMPVQNLGVSATADGFDIHWTCKTEGASFVVEQRIFGGEWEPVTTTDETSVSIKLPMGRYQFRVMAVRDGMDSGYVTSDVLLRDNIVDPVSITASGNYASQPASLAGDQSGLSERNPSATHDNHRNGHTMWLSNDNPEGEVWLQFDFGRVYSLYETYLWNYNQHETNPDYPSLHQASLKYVKIFYTTDGESWEQFTNYQCTGDAGYEGYFKLAPGTGEANLAATNLADGKGVLNFGGLEACGIRFEIPNERDVGNYGWYVEGSRNNYGISEVMFTTTQESNPSVATLSSLELEGLSLSPAFDSTEFTYEAVLPFGWSELTVRAEPDVPDAAIKVNGEELTDGEVTLSTGNLNSVNVVVTSADGKNTLQYSVKLQYTDTIQPVGATAGSQYDNGGSYVSDPMNIINGVGMVGTDYRTATHDNHGGAETMWQSGEPSTNVEDAWVCVDLGDVYSLNELWIWNFNQFNSSFVGGDSSGDYLTKRGMNQVKIEYSLDGNTWTDLGETSDQAAEGVFSLAMGTSEAKMKATNLADGQGPVQFAGAEARYVRISAAGGVNVGNWGGYTGSEQVFGLSELVFTGALPRQYGVSGTVSAGDTGADVEGLTVALYDRYDELFQNPFAKAVTAADGSYSFDGTFAPGGYVVRIEPAPGAYGPSTASVTVEDGEVTDADITLVPMALESISVKSQPGTEYEVGDVFDPAGLVLELHDNTTGTATLAYTEENAADFGFEPDLETPLTTADTKVTITYGGCSVELPITVKAQEPGGGTSVSRYAITVTQGAGGRISPSTVSVAKGSDKTFTITANEGYRIADVLVDGRSVGAVSSYTFENVTAKHTIEARFEKAEEGGNASPFLDVKDSDWFAEAVQYVAEKGLMNGTSATKFSPSGDTTRGMIVTILYRQAGSPAVESDGAAWWSDARAWAMEKGVSDGTDMEAPITREQLAAMLYRYAGLQEADVSARGDLGAFADGGRVSAYAVEALQWAVAEGIVTGKTGGVIDPQAGATRAETAAMLMRFCENILK